MKIAHVDDPESNSNAMVLIRVWERASNYPSTPAGIEALARGLERASKDFEIPMHRIVEACTEVSKFCPTDGELLAIARNLAEPERIAAEDREDREWHRKMQAECGPPEPFIADWSLATVQAAKSREARMYRDIKQHLGLHMGKFRDGRHVTWSQMAEAARKLGYEDYAIAWESSLVHGVKARGWNEAKR